MKIILLVLCFTSVNSWAWEWNQKAFKESVNQYKSNIEEWSKNPSKIIKDFKNKYEPSVNLIKEEAKNFNYENTMAPVREYYNFFENKYKSYAALNEKDLFNTFSRDVSNTFQWAYQNFEAIPVVGPYKRDIQMKADLIQIQIVPYRYMMQGALERSF